MIKFLDFLTPFINEVFRVKRQENKYRPVSVTKKVFGYAIITMSLLGNYFFAKKIYTLSVSNYALTVKLETQNELPELLRICDTSNDILIAIIDNKLDRTKPIKRKDDLDFILPDKYMRKDPTRTIKNNKQNKETPKIENLQNQNGQSAIERHRNRRPSNMDSQNNGSNRTRPVQPDDDAGQ